MLHINVACHMCCAALHSLPSHKQIKSLPPLAFPSALLPTPSSARIAAHNQLDNVDYQHRDDHCLLQASHSGLNFSNSCESPPYPPSLSLSLSDCQVQHLINHFLSTVCLHFYTLPRRKRKRVFHSTALHSPYWSH